MFSMKKTCGLFSKYLRHFPRYSKLKSGLGRVRTTMSIISIAAVLSMGLGCSQEYNGPMSLLPSPGIAYAYPISGISIDGDITDWPEALTHFPMENTLGKKPKNTEDLNAYFTVGYNVSHQSLYFAMVVSDESYISGNLGISEKTIEDRYTLYVDERHAPNGSGPIIYQFGELGAKLIGRAESWDPKVRDANLDDVEVVVKRQGSQTVYEARIGLDSAIYAGKSFGLDHVIIDKDLDDKKENHTRLIWGRNRWKDEGAGRLGSLVLLDVDQPMGLFHGRLEWKDFSKDMEELPNAVSIRSTDPPALWVKAQVDSTGRYVACLPVGHYEVSPVGSLYRIGGEWSKLDSESSTTLFTVNKNEEVTVPVLQLSVLPEPDLIPEKGVLYSFDREKEILLDNFIESYRRYYEIPGLSLALLKNGRVIYHKTYGVKNSYTLEPVQASTLFEAASITKPVFAFAVCSLAEKGIIDLDRPLYQYLPFPDIAHDKRYERITARQVLSHQTGFPNWPVRDGEGKFELKFTPGTAYGYSGEGYEYLKRVVVQLTGKTISDILKEEVLGPLDIGRTHFKKSDSLIKMASRGHYNNLPSGTYLGDDPSMAGGMHTEAKAFSDFVLAMSNRRGLRPETYGEIFGKQIGIPLDEDLGKSDREEYFGLGIYQEKTSYGRAFGHDGNNGDFQCQFMMYEDLDMGYIIFTNSNTGGELAYEALGKFLILGKE